MMNFDFCECEQTCILRVRQRDLGHVRDIRYGNSGIRLTQQFHDTRKSVFQVLLQVFRQEDLEKKLCSSSADIYELSAGFM